MIDWLFGTVLGKCVMTFLISLLPVVELRGGIPYGISQGLDPWLAFAASALGNMLPVPFLLLFVRKILHWMKRYPRLGRLAVSLERRADRLKKQLKGDASAAPELALVERLIAELGAGSAARAVTLDDKERELIKPMQLLSYKPTIYAANISEEFIRRPLAENPLYTALERRAKEENAEIIAVCAEIEAEIAELDEDELEALKPENLLAALARDPAPTQTPPEALEDLEGPKEPDPPVIEEPDDPRSVYSVLLDCCSLDEDLLRYLIDVLQRNADKEFQKLALVTTRKAFPPEALLEWLAGLESRATREELICSAVMDACLDRLASEDQKELMAALLSGDRKTFELFRCEAPELVHLPQATFEWYAENYLDHYYPIRYLIRFNGIRLPEAPR